MPITIYLFIWCVSLKTPEVVAVKMSFGSCHFIEQRDQVKVPPPAANNIVRNKKIIIRISWY